MAQPMVCPNGHPGQVEDTGHRLSDGQELRRVLTCGCHPTAAELGLPVLPAALPPEPVQTARVEDEEPVGATHADMRTLALIRKVLAEQGLG